MNKTIKIASEDGRVAITKLFANASPILVEVRFPKQGVSPDWYLFEEEDEFEAILDQLGPNAEIHVHSVWDLNNRKGSICLNR